MKRARLLQKIRQVKFKEAYIEYKLDKKPFTRDGVLYRHSSRNLTIEAGF